MRSRLQAHHYTSDEVLRREQVALFQRLWIFAGFRTLLSAPDAFITHQIGGVPIVVQNGRDNVLRAFINRCAHRGAPIQIDDFGQRRLACPYHGWTYDDTGRVKSIPGNDAHYGFTGECIAGLRLEPVALRSIGNLVFVNLSKDPRPIETQFHQVFLDQIAEVSSHLDDEAIFAKVRAAYNWKLNFENVVDWNHVPFVHSNSFAPLMTSGGKTDRLEAPCSPPEEDPAVGNDIRDLSYSTNAPFDMRPWPWHALVERFGQADQYYNFFIYPNVNFISMGGVIFLAQQFMPVNANLSETRLTMCTARKTAKLPALPAILWSHLRAEKRVIDEDIRVLEGLHLGFADDSPRAMHGSYESRLRRIANVYLDLIHAND